MGCTLELVLGLTLLISTCCQASDLSREIRQVDQTNDSSKNVTRNTTEIINNRDLNKIEKTDTTKHFDSFPLSFFPKENSTESLENDKILVQKDSKVTKVGEDRGRSIDFDIDKFGSEEIHNKNVFTLTPSPDAEKFFDHDLDFFSTTHDAKLESPHETTTSKNSFFDLKHKEAVDSVEQKLENGSFEDEMDDGSKEFEIEDTLQEPKANKTKVEYTKVQSITKKGNDPKRTGLDIELEETKHIDVVNTYNNTNTYDETTVKTYEDETEKKEEDEKTSEITTTPRLIQTTKKASTNTKPSININNSHILSNTIESETIKAVNVGSPTSLPATSKKTSEGAEAVKMNRTETATTNKHKEQLTLGNHDVPVIIITTTERDIKEIPTTTREFITTIPTTTITEPPTEVTTVENTQNPTTTESTEKSTMPANAETTLTSRINFPVTTNTEESTTENKQQETTTEKELRYSKSLDFDTTTTEHDEYTTESIASSTLSELVPKDIQGDQTTTSVVTETTTTTVSDVIASTTIAYTTSSPKEITYFTSSPTVTTESVTTTEQVTTSEAILTTKKTNLALEAFTTMKTTTTTPAPPTTEIEKSEEQVTTTQYAFIHIEKVDGNHTTLLPETLNPSYGYPAPDVVLNNYNRTKSENKQEENLVEETTTSHSPTATEEGLMNDPEEGTQKGMIAAIVISTVGAVCLIVLAGLLFIIRKRQKRFNYGQRCKPVNLEDYSMDNVSVYNSMRRKTAQRASKRSYGNPAFEDPVVSHPLNFSALAKFAANFDDIKAEFDDVPQIAARTSELPEGCESKNRYANVIPLPETRVFLTAIENYPNSDYINANYVTGPKNVKGYYIATQAPMQNTVDDFWRMVWEQQSKVILMITHLFENGIEKCVDYLPASEVLDCHRLFGDFQVTLKKREVKDKYIISCLQLKNMVSNSWREVTHLWYLGWPDKGVPTEANSLIAFLIEARSYMKSATLDKKNAVKENDMKNGACQNEVNPVVVHCSPGTGRTGVVIACDIAIREFEQTRLVDVPKIVYKIRRDRAGAVQTKEQYRFIYKVVSLYATKLTGGALESM